MADVDAFRDYQLRSSLLAERQRAMEAQRATVHELRVQVDALQRENALREEQLRAEHDKYMQKKAQQDAKVRARDEAVRAYEEQLRSLTEEQEQLQAAIAEREAQTRAAADELARRRALEARVTAAEARLQELKTLLEERDAAVMRLEARVARHEMTSDKRHAAFAEALPSYAQLLPRVAASMTGDGDKADASAAYDGSSSMLSDAAANSFAADMAGESVLLVDDVLN